MKSSTRVLLEIADCCSPCSMIMHSIGFAFILIGINYLILQERILGMSAGKVEHYVNEAVVLFDICDNSLFLKTIRRFVVSMTVTW